MMTDQFEAAFGAFLDSADYDGLQEEWQEHLFAAARKAFAAGWQAALAQQACSGQEPAEK